MRAVVLHSGGQDSTTCLLEAVHRHGASGVTALQINYGQRHKVELECAVLSCEHLGVPYIRVDLPPLPGFGGDALTGGDEVQVETDLSAGGNQFAREHDLPSTFVPGRNLLFLSIATAYAAKIGAHEIWTGVCAADEAGYPDCRPEFVWAMDDVIQAALDDPNYEVIAPLLSLTKGQTFKLADNLGGLDLILEYTHTCYQGDHETRNEWGYGCSECGSCLERQAGWVDYKEEWA